MGIGGNTLALLQVRSDGNKNAIGERVNSWIDKKTILGWLDLSTGDSNRSNFYAKIQESTHIFLCDYFDFDGSAGKQDNAEITSNNSRLVVNGKVYDVLLIDDPMGAHEHLEIYLKYVGGQ